jgi:UDP-N-acetyl-D-mannosaminuronate dehydrogenase
MNLIKRIQQKDAVIAVVGLGYVGLPLVLAYARAGFQPLGLDIDSSKIDHLHAGTSYIKHIPTASVAEARAGANSMPQPTSPASRTATQSSSASPRRSTNTSSPISAS